MPTLWHLLCHCKTPQALRVSWSVHMFCLGKSASSFFVKSLQIDFCGLWRRADVWFWFMHKLCSWSGEQRQTIETSPCSPPVSQWIIRKRHLETAATTVTASVVKPNMKLRSVKRHSVLRWFSSCWRKAAGFHLEHFNRLLPAWWHHPTSAGLPCT